MNETIFQNNLACLAKHQPNLAIEIQALPSLNPNIELIKTRTPLPSMRYRSPDHESPILLHSAYDPMREAQRWAEGIPLTDPTNIILLGMGLGYHALVLLKQHHQTIRFLTIIEQDLSLLRQTLALLDLRFILDRTGVKILAGENPDDISVLMDEERRDIIIHNFKLLAHNPSVRCHQAYYTEVQDKLLKALTHDEVNLKTTIENRGRNQFNILMNMPSLFQGYALKDCHNLLSGYPAIVSAAGPSLDKNAHLLKSIQDRAALFCVDTAQTTFMKLDIKPDVVVTADPTELNFSHFEAINQLGESILAFHPEVNRRITQKFENHPYRLPMFDQNSFLLSYLFDEEVYGWQERAMNVGHIAFNLAVLMGCSPIILVGFDYAFPRDGGTSHAKHAAVSRTIDAIQKDGSVNIGGKEGKAIAESGTMNFVPGYYGEQVPTTVPFQLYIRSLEKTITETEASIIDATEGGAYFEGSIRMPLAKALETHLAQSGVKEHLDQFKHKRPSPDFDEIITKLNNGRRVLQDSIKICNELKQMLSEWPQLLRQPSLTMQEAQKRWADFDALWIKMCGEPMFDGFLGTSVQHIYLLRQKATILSNQTPHEFLKTMYDKYQIIMDEMLRYVPSFDESIALSIQSMETKIKARLNSDNPE